MTKENKKWIQEGKFKKDTYRNYIQKEFGNDGFDSKGNIKPSISKKLASDETVYQKTRKRARLHLNLLDIQKKSKGKK
jgi:hypothetical protein